ncbi:ferritin-like domain-containing protein [Paenibacillus gorillae]|uniref:ferritin-like domain-containing protein n=1 Tax=Paenibacillus gorillae TaxID=1243662 RepID=UPI0004BCC70B|nr:ferritin-like domain-containing protein [Paenibacillus gorillae]
MEVQFAKWRAYFLYNQDHLQRIDWGDEYRLTASERKAVTRSIQQFQLGENSEGKHLISNAKAYIDKTKDEAYFGAIVEFIREEQRHARDLAKFMRLQQIPIIREHWVDGVFRKLRKFAGLEQSIIVLITAEIIAKIYYKALRDSTSSTMLIQLCDQILLDEDKHVQFQSETLHKLSYKRNPFINSCYRGMHRFLLEGTLAVVWRQHRSVFKAGGYRLGSFYRECRKEFTLSNAIIAGEGSFFDYEPISASPSERNGLS